jgi:hypothetical protein
MAIPDYVLLEVLLRRAAGLQQTRAELDDVDRLLRGGHTEETGLRVSCSSPNSRGAAFCWRCRGLLRASA